VQKLLSAAEEAQTESAKYQTEPGTLSMTGRKQRREKTRRITRAKAQAEAVNYRKLDKEVKKSCKQDKKDWIESNWSQEITTYDTDTASTALATNTATNSVQDGRVGV